MLDDDDQRMAVQEYIADMSCLIARKLCRADLPMYRMIKRARHKRYDNRSAEDIVKDIIAKRRRKRSGGENK